MSTVAPQPPAAAENSAPLEVKSGPGTPTWEIARLFPTQGDWTESEYLALDTNQLIEFTHGCLQFLPMPTRLHQDLLKFLYRWFDDFVTKQNLGRVYFAPLRIRVAGGKYREPDLVFLEPDRLQGDPTEPPDGANLVLEVVSPGKVSGERDLESKRKEYAEAGISEYWIVDPETRKITVLTLDGKEYRIHGEFAAGATATSVLLKGFGVAVDAVFAAAETSDAPAGGEQSAK